MNGDFGKSRQPSVGSRNSRWNLKGNKDVLIFDV